MNLTFVSPEAADVFFWMLPGDSSLSGIHRHYSGPLWLSLLGIAKTWAHK